MDNLTPLPSIRPGLYQHYKGALYEVLGVVRHSETLEALVLYRPRQANANLWVRPYAMFLGKVEVDGKSQARFVFLAPALASTSTDINA